MRVVCHTNIFVSALGFGGKPRQILELVGKDFVLVVSEPLLRELRRILTSKFGWTDERAVPVIRELTHTAELVAAAIHISECRDPDDDRILEAAIAGKADYIVSGDADLLSMNTFRGVEILSVADFLARLNSTEAG